MDAEEVRFRVACEARKAAGRVRSSIAPPQWRRRDLAGLLSRNPGSGMRDPGSGQSCAGTGALSIAERALRQGDIASAHRALAAHFASRPSRFPLDPRSLDTLGARIRGRFPDAVADASRRADRMLAGRYDVLGYRDLSFGHPPAWHTDPTNDRRAPSGFWSAVRYLDPQSGDHKVIWELNRHQHWLALGRAHQLTGERRYYTAFVDQLDDWIRRNPPLHGVNWASMLELGFRSLSWLWSLHFFAAAAREDRPGDAPWTVDLLMGVDRQLSHVAHNLSTYFSPNTHLSGEALALYVAGCALPELTASAHRTALGRRILLEQIDRQIGGDGGHRELSAHYHRYSTDFYLLAALTARVSGDAAAPAFEQAALRQATYLRTIADDDGRLPLIGDDDGGQLFPICGRAPADCRDTLAAASVVLNTPALAVSAIPEEVFWLCGALPLEDMPRSASPWPSAALSDSGYYVSRTPQDHLVFDAGRHGFLNGGHAHSDALAVVVTIAGRPLLVDGTATYDESGSIPIDRDAQHGRAGRTPAVGTPRSPFHWQSTAHARSLVWSAGDGFDYTEGMHDGYLPAIHARGVLALHGIGWVVIDHLLGPAGSAAIAEAFWHVNTDRRATATGRGVTFRHGDGSEHALASSSSVEVVSGEEASGLDGYAPEYGRIERATCLHDRSAGPLPRSVATFISSATDASPRIAIEAVPITDDAESSWHSTAFRMSWAGCEAIVLAAVELSPEQGSGGGPGKMWGSEEARTDARVAFVPISGTSSQSGDSESWSRQSESTVAVIKLRLRLVSRDSCW